MLDSQVKGLYFQPQGRALNLLKRAYIHILQYFQIHYPVYSFFIVTIDHPHILDILHIYYYVSNKGKMVICCWIPSHVGIHGNNEADRAAKSTRDFEIVKLENSFNRPLTFYYLRVTGFGKYFGTLVI